VWLSTGKQVRVALHGKDGSRPGARTNTKSISQNFARCIAKQEENADCRAITTTDGLLITTITKRAISVSKVSELFLDFYIRGAGNA